MTVDSLSLLRGSWRVIECIEAGEDARDPDDDEKFLWFTDDLIVSGDKWAAWDMPYSCSGQPNKGVLQITREDQREPWVANAIFAITGDELRVCMGSKPTDRPTGFESTPENRYVFYRAVRCDEPVPS